MIAKRFLQVLGFVLLLAFGGQAAFAHTDDTKDTQTNSCDTWGRYNRDKTYGSHDRNASGDTDLDKQYADTPEDLYLENGGDSKTSPRYGLRAKDFYIQALGGGGYGAGGQDDPEHRSGEGGVVQGEVDLRNDVAPNAASIPDVDFSVNAFSMDDPLDRSRWKDTALGGCISVADNKVNPGEKYLPTSQLPYPYP